MSTSERKRRLSVAMIVRNCEAALAESLASITGLADEIVVLDTGSTDRTPQVAQQFGAKLFRAAWEDSFATARNQCLTYASGDWILWIDAGERVERDQSAKLREFIDTEADLGAAYTVRISVPPAERHIGGEEIVRFRLHPNRPGLQFFGRVRESLDRSLTAFGLRRDSSAITIARGTREHDERLKRIRAQRNIHLADLQIAGRGPSPDLLNCLGEAFQTLGDAERAVQHYERARQMAEPGSPELLEAYYGLLTCFDGRRDNRNAQLALCMQAVEVFPLDAQLLCALGGYLQSLGHVELAGRSYELAVRHGQIESTVWHLPDIREIAATCRSIVAQSLGHFDEAREGLVEARAEFPHSLRLARQALELAVNQGRQEEAADILNELPRGSAQLDSLRTAAKGACLAARGNWPAARTYLDAAFAAGCRERLCLRWLVATCVEQNEPAAAVPALTAWEQAEGRTPEVLAWRDKLGTPVDSSEAGRSTIPLGGGNFSHVRFDQPAPLGVGATQPISRPVASRQPS